ncbi:MAG: haloacid dehalogenase-like hydrolase [Myxococcota bacterium]
MRLPPVPPAAWFVLNQREVKARVTRLGGLAAAVGLSLASPLGERQVATKLAWAGIRGMSEDRLHVLAEEYAERQITPHIRASAVELVERAKKDGCRIVFVSEWLDVLVKPLADQLGADRLVANRMELSDGTATGRLLDPVVGQLSGQWATALAAELGADPARSRAYGHSGGDALLLSAVAEPCAVHPDWRLRRIARDHDWPIVER